MEVLGFCSSNLRLLGMLMNSTRKSDRTEQKSSAECVGVSRKRYRLDSS